MAPIRALLVDDHQLVRQGIRFLLEQEESVQVAGEAANAEEALTQIEQLTPDVVLLDIALPGVSGLELAQMIRSRFPAVRILALTMHAAEEYVRGMLRAGADGYLLKHSSATELLDAIHLVYNNRMVFPRITGALVGEPSGSRTPLARQSDVLTEREREILSHIALGETSREIAKRIYLSAKTVDNYRARILEKLQAHNVAEAVAFALRRGLISLEMEAQSSQADYR